MTELTYEQMRHLSEIGEASGRLVLKNRKGVILKKQINKWDLSPLGTKSTSMVGEQKHTPASMGSHFLTCQPVSSLQHQRPRVKR